MKIIFIILILSGLGLVYLQFLKLLEYLEYLNKGKKFEKNLNADDMIILLSYKFFETSYPLELIFLD